MTERGRWKRRIGFGIGALILVGLLGYLGRGTLGGGKAADSALKTAPVARRDIGTTISATGMINPRSGAEVEVRSRISGTLKELRVKVGDRVKAGEMIARLDSREQQARVERAQADLLAAEARRDLIQRGARPEEVEQAQARLQQAEVDLSLAEKGLERHSLLFHQGVISPQEMDRVRREYDAAVAGQAFARQALSLAQRKYTDEELRSAEAQVAQAQAALREAQILLSYTTLIAPISGVIASISTQEGETVSAGQIAPTFVKIIDLGRLKADAYVDEIDIGKVQVGQEAILTVDSHPDLDFQGKVESISPKATIQGNVVTYDVEIGVEDPQGLLKPDMTATVTLLVKRRQRVLAVPDAAIRREGGKKVVYVLQDARPARREVKTGWREGGYTEITSGLREGERVILGQLPG